MVEKVKLLTVSLILMASAILNVYLITDNAIYKNKALEELDYVVDEYIIARNFISQIESSLHISKNVFKDYREERLKRIKELK